MRKTSRILLALLIVAVAVPAFAQQERDRSKIEDKYKWDLTPLYASDEAWSAAKDKLVAELKGLEKFRGTLAQSPQQLLAAMEESYRLQKEFARLYAYAAMASDRDTRDAKYQAMQQQMGLIGTDFSAATSWMQPEILKMDRATVDGFFKQEPKLAIYRQPIDDVLRRKAHTRSESEEKLIADAGLMADGAAQTYGIFADADFPFPKITLADGKEVTIDKANFGLYRASTNREDRRKTFEAYLGALNDYRATFGSTLNAAMLNHVFTMRARNYDSTLHASLDRANIPVEVYHQHVANVNKALPSLHRYLGLRKKMMGLDEMHYYDLYAPLVKNVDLNYSVDEAGKLISASLAPLGKEYVSVVQKALAERWIDMYPNEGKRSGAYSQGAAYDVHPYMLMNYMGKYDDVSTLTHELGHTMQSYFSNKTQPFATADYPIFVAEVASTFNEALLNDYMLKQIKDDETRLAILGAYLENLRLTVFRQTQFAEFELRAHEMAEKGQPLTGDNLNALYLDIVRKYYGHDKGVTTVDEHVKSEWAHIPHFYYNYYVYQYATSFTASAALSEKVMTGDKAATKRYLDFLSAGGSDYPIALLKNAGVDMTTSQPIDLTMQKMNRVMDEIEKILAKKK
jgi:oligoendopeptidase F